MGKNQKDLRLQQLYEEYSNSFPGMELVFGDGNSESGIIMIGEAPGKDEVSLGKPFVGIAGGNLSKFMEFLGLTRNDIYVTNAIKYRLFKINEKTGRKSNRPARVSEVVSSRKFLMKELEILKPFLVLTLGNVPLKAVTGNQKMNIGGVHGKEIPYSDFTIFPLYHPASLIYNRSLEETYYNDLKTLRKLLKEDK